VRVGYGEADRLHELAELIELSRLERD